MKNDLLTIGGLTVHGYGLMIGIGFEIRLGREKLARLAKILILRYGLAVFMAVAAYQFLPFDLDVRRAMALVALGPVSSVATAYTGRLEGDVELASAINSLSILMGVVTTTAALLIML